MNPRAAFVFPGQGSQYVGMGKTFLERVPEALDLFATAERLSGVPVRRLCVEGPIEELTRTSNLQPCLTAVEILCCLAARDAGLAPAAVAGHSLGEYPALWAAGVLTFEDTMRLVGARGRLMEGAGDQAEGAMAAVIGLDRNALEEMLAPLAAQGVLAMANHNSPEQIVVTGERFLVDALCLEAKARGARAVPLKVSAAFHSPLMREAAKRFAEVVEGIRFSPPLLPFYSNVTALPESDPGRIRALMAEQICAPVKWYEIVTGMARDGISCFIEIGPKRVLTNLIQKSFPAGTVGMFQVEDPEGLDKCLPYPG